jgi:translation initiation factor 1
LTPATRSLKLEDLPEHPPSTTLRTTRSISVSSTTRQFSVQSLPISSLSPNCLSLEIYITSHDPSPYPGLQQRNGRKTLTTVQGLPDKFDPKKLLKAMKKEFACNGHVVASAEDESEDEDAPAAAAKGQDFGRVLQFQGDQRTKTKDWLVSAGIVSEKDAKTKIVM